MRIYIYIYIYIYLYIYIRVKGIFQKRFVRFPIKNKNATYLNQKKQTSWNNLIYKIICGKSKPTPAYFKRPQHKKNGLPSGRFSSANEIIYCFSPNSFDKPIKRVHMLSQSDLHPKIAYALCESYLRRGLRPLIQRFHVQRIIIKLK